ncbi:Peroxisome chaperone and import receptor, partial [Coemansia nantahalensis]
MADVPPNDAELDELLDSALEEFSTPAPPPPPRAGAKPAASAAPAAANAAGAAGSASFEDEFMRQLTQGMEDMLKGSSGEAGSGSDSEMRSAFDQLLKQMGSLPGDLGAAQQEPAAPTGEAADGEPASFQDKIKATMDKLKESADQADADAGADLGGAGMMEELMRQLDQAGDDPQLDSLVDDVIGQLMSKEVLQQPLRDLDAAYPKYLAENKDSLSADELRRYEKQHGCIREILALFGELDDDAANDPRVVDLLQKMQDCGQPPSELLKLLAPDMELDGDGNVKVPEAPNCTVINYCGACVQDRLLQHGWLADLAARPQAARGWDADSLRRLYAYQSERLQARRQRVAALRAQIQAREQQIAAARRVCSELAERVGARQVELLEHERGPAAQLERDALEASEAAGKSAAQQQRASAMLRADRRTLADALCEVVGLQLAPPASGGDVFSGMDAQARLFGLPWPSTDDWAKYPSDYINACVSHCVQVFSVLAHYLHLRLPFEIVKRRSSLFIRPSLREADGGEAGPGEAALSVGDANRASFVVGLGMLFYDVAYMCHRQGVRVATEHITEVIGNLRQAVVALADRENEARLRLPFTLDVYAVVQEVLKMYAASGDAEADA